MKFSFPVSLIYISFSSFCWMIQPVSGNVSICHKSVSGGDIAAGINAIEDPSCEPLNSIGCFAYESAFCRHCAEKVTDASSHLLPCPSPKQGPSPKQDNEYCSQSICTNDTSGDCVNNITNECTSSNVDGTCPVNYKPCSKVLLFDDFDTFDLSIWKHDITMAGGGNWEFQLYRNNRTNSYVENGSLHIKPSLTEDWLPGLGPLDLYGLTDASDCTSNAFYGCQRDDASPISSAKLTTVNSFSFKSGRLEVRAKLPRGDWLWPAIWLLPKYENYGLWPASGEIDVMESTGNAPGYGGGYKGHDSIFSALQWGVDKYQNQQQRTVANYTLSSSCDDDFTSDYHIFGLVRHDNGLYTYVDDDENRILDIDWTTTSFYDRGQWNNETTFANPWKATTLNGTPFVNEEFYLIFNVAVGGTNNYFPDGFGNKPWLNTSPQAQADFYSKKDEWYPTWIGHNATAFEIDWVKVTAE